MKLIAVNGSPRKNWNTATLLQHALDGASSRGAETKMIHLTDLGFTGCMSCFACKRKGGSSYGACALTDDLTPILEEIFAADGLVLGSPIYFGALSGATQCFVERLMFPKVVYADPFQSLVSGKINTGLIYTMNLPEAEMEQMGLKSYLMVNEMRFGLVFGSAETLFCNDTCQFEDYAAVVQHKFDPEHKKRRREAVFPKDCEAAAAMGARLVAP